MKKKYIISIVILIFVFIASYKPVRTEVIKSSYDVGISIIKFYWPKFRCHHESGCRNTKFTGAENEFFSQRYEDYILSHVFKDTEQGFYIDVGANNPNKYSATLYFHKKGWKGVNFEPQPALYDMLLKYRPDDINIKKAVSDNIGTAIFYTQSDVSVLGTLDEKVKEIKKKSYEIQVEVTTLTKELTEHNIQNIDLLKIDVEGFEGHVIKGFDLQQFRPKVMILEYISPTQDKGYLEFEPKILENGYILALDDGLNRYYYRKENPEFKERFDEIGRCMNIDKMCRN